MFALSMVLLIFGLIAVALDLSELYEAHVRFYDAAEQAALAGASEVVVCPAEELSCSQAAENGQPPELDLSAYAAACRQAGDAFSGIAASTSCSVVGADTVRATVSAPISVVIPIPGMGGSFPISATYEAAPVLGAQQPAA